MAHLRTLWSAFGRVAARRRLMIAGCGVLAFLACYGMEVSTSANRLPEIGDEYGHLLAGDTFAHGRLTNPRHPLARCFETFHILVEPTYQSPYPPGPGLFIALGQWINGHPITGVILSCTLLASAICWALMAWFPPRWAVVGTLLGVTTLLCTATPLGDGVPGYWAHSYWGGAVAALGGALLFGAAKRLTRSPTPWASIALGLGPFFLAISRPFEGLLLCVPVGAYVLWWLINDRRSSLARRALRLTPGVLVSAAGLAWIAYYNWRGTGDALQLPYTVYRERYQMLPIFRWQEVRPLPPNLNQEMLNYAYLELDAGKMFSQPARRLADYARVLVGEAGPLAAILCVLMLPWTLRARSLWLVFASSVVILVGMWFSYYFEFHYHAPAAVLTLILATASLRQLTLFHKGPRPLYAAVVAGVLLVTGVQCYRAWTRWENMPKRVLQHWALSRQEVIDTLVQGGGRHVVFVKYGPRHSPHAEVVHNTADIDAQPVVWVRALEDWQNQEVLEYYKDRTAWLMLIEDDNGYAKVTPFPRPR